MSVFKYGKTTSDFVRKFRERENLSQSELCHKLGYSTGQQVSNIERGIHKNPQSFIDKLSTLLSKEERAHLMDLFYGEKLDSIGFRFASLNKKVKLKKRKT